VSTDSTANTCDLLPSRFAGLYVLCALTTMVLVAILLPRYAAAATDTTEASSQEDVRWNELKPTMFGERKIEEGSDIISMEAPQRAHDAAVVPITINANIPQSKDLRNF